MSFQASLSGINAASQKLDVIGVNVANAQTVGFKEGEAKFADTFVNKTQGMFLGSGALSMRLAQRFEQGGLQSSVNTLDIAISGQGFFQVQRPDGSLAYTRNGEFHTDKDQYLVTVEGDKVMGANGPIQIDLTKYSGSLRISRDGVISGSDGVTRGPDKVVQDPLNLGQTITVAGDLMYQEIGRLELHSFRNIGGLESLGGNLWGESNATGTRVSGKPGVGIFGLVEAGMTEASNADLNENLVNMIVAQREYQGNSQAMKIQLEMDLSLAKL